MQAIETPVIREAIAHFGPGRLTVTPRGERQEGAVWRVAFEPQNVRERIMVKVECERLREGKRHGVKLDKRRFSPIPHGKQPAVFRANLTTHSDANRPPNPIQTDH